MLFGALLGLIAVALGGSLWAWFDASECGACSGARELLGGRSLAPIGAGFYGILLMVGAFFGRSRLFFSALLVAASAHVVLLLFLHQRGIVCPPCILVGGAAIAGAALSCWADTDNFARGSVLLPIGAVLSQAALLATASFQAPGSTSGMAALPEARLEAHTAATPGTARLLIYSRAGCRYCDELEEDVLPELLREFSGRLEVDREQASPSLPTPTIVVSGAAKTVFPGLPPVARLREAILRAFGRDGEKLELDHESSMLPKPR